MFRRLQFSPSFSFHKTLPDVHNLVTVSRGATWSESLIIDRPTFTLEAMCILLTVLEPLNSACLQPCRLISCDLLSNTFVTVITFVTFLWFEPIWGVVNSSCLLAMVLFSWRGSDGKNRTGKELILSSAQKLHQSESWKWKEQDWKKMKEIESFRMENKDSFPVSHKLLVRIRFPIACSFSNAQDSVASNRQSYCKNSKWNHEAMRICIFHTFDSTCIDSLRIWFVIYPYLLMRLQLASQP